MYIILFLRYDPDRVRQEDLSTGRIERFKRSDYKSKGSNEGTGAKSKNSGVVEALLELVDEITWKHALEREVKLCKIRIWHVLQHSPVKVPYCKMG